MKSEKKILLPLDGSESSLAALVLAKSISILLNMVVSILYVSDEDLCKEKLLQKLDLKKEDLHKFIINHKKGNPAEIIIQESENSSYVVMSTHGTTKNMSIPTGSVSNTVIENSNVPVLLIRPDMVLCFEENLWKPKKALIPINGTPGAAQALSPAMKILTKVHSEIDLLHISTSKIIPPGEPGTFTAPYYEDYPQHEWTHWSKEFLKRFGCVNDIKINISLSKGDPGEEIIFFLKKNNNDFIAMAWHGKLNSEHAKILRKIMFEAPCPILLIKIIS
ncbi:MAG: universal stress protein [bacterium]